MAASREGRPAAFETDIDDFEDVALLLEPDQEQQQSRKRPSWKSQVLDILGRGGRRERAGFEKLQQAEDELNDSGRKTGTACSCHWVA